MPSQILYENLLIFNILYFCYCYGGGEDEELGKKNSRNYSSRTRKTREGYFFFFFQPTKIQNFDENWLMFCT